MAAFSVLRALFPFNQQHHPPHLYHILFQVAISNNGVNGFGVDLRALPRHGGQFNDSRA
jgi:hypothetical protein